MRKMRLTPKYQTPNTSKKHPQHKVWPYLLKGLAITRPNQVPLSHRQACVAGQWVRRHQLHPDATGFLYLVAIMDWFSREVLAWRLSNSMEAEFCVEALQDAIARCGKPETMNSDQGSQFTGFEWTNALSRAGVKL